MTRDLFRFLESLPDLGARPQRTMQAADFMLDRILGLLARLGDPQQKYPCIHVAGTNGKGSVCAFCAASLMEQGYRIGAFTSPHIEGALYGIQINNQIVDLSDLEATFKTMLPQLDDDQGWTQFEIITALAFVHFARAGVNAAVIEVGLGGRLDATNVIVPVVSVITSIDYDHTSILGNTLAKIAIEKAGIIKPHVPVVVAPQTEEARKAILSMAEARKALVVEVGKDFLFERVRSDLSGQEIRVWPSASPNDTKELRIDMLGSYQVENAATAFAALKVASQYGLHVDDAAIERGFAAARWPGRFEVLQENPTVVLDAAHTPNAALRLSESLGEYFPQQEIVMLLGVSEDKDIKGLLRPLMGSLGDVITTQSSHPRAMPAARLAESLGALGLQAKAEPNPARALKTALSMAGNKKMVLVAGSVFLVEQVREIYFNRSKQ